MVKTGRYKKNSYYIGILKKFQWVGIMISTDNPISLNEYFVFYGCGFGTLIILKIL